MECDSKECSSHKKLRFSEESENVETQFKYVKDNIYRKILLNSGEETEASIPRFLNEKLNLQQIGIKSELDKGMVTRAVTLSARKKYLKDYLQMLLDVRKSEIAEEKSNYAKIKKIFVCCGCCIRFVSYNQMIDHMKRATSHLIWRCSICLLTFETENICQVVLHGPDYHIDNANEFPERIPIELIGANPLGGKLELKEVCPECRKGVGSVITHLWLSRQKHPAYHCPYCNVFFTRNVCRFNLHIKVHKNMAPFRCPDCAKLFKNCVELHIHLNENCRHLEQITRYKCSVCELIFHSDSSLKRHLFSDHNPVKYKCHLCPAKMNIASEKNRHYNEHHLGELTPSRLRRIKAYIVRHKCAVCGKANLKGFSYERHVRKHFSNHKFKITSFVCNCGFITMYKGTYLTHKSTACITNYFSPIKDSSAILKKCLQCLDLKFYNGKDPFICEKCVYYQDSKTIPFYKCSLCSKLLHYSMEHVVLHFQIDHKLKETDVPYKNVIKVSYDSKKICTKGLIPSSEPHVPTSMTELLTKEPKQFSETNPETEGDIAYNDFQNANLNEDSKHGTFSADSVEVRISNKAELNKDLSASQLKNCYKCPASFDDKDQLRSHYVSEHRENTGDFHCLECGEAFRSIKSLSIHLHSHGITDAENYVNRYDVSSELSPLNSSFSEDGIAELLCPVCDKTFNSPFKHNQHMRSHGMAFLKRIKKVDKLN